MQHFNDFFLGIDTSCYTTSAALLDENGNVIREDRRLLKVKLGMRGLPQSEMVYQHTRHLPQVLETIIGKDGNAIKAIGVSFAPRRRNDSYMPAFLVGKGFGEVISQILQCPCYQFSHQENHIMAALRNVPKYWGKNGYMIHVSGGTTDCLSLSWSANHFVSDEVTSTVDISAGQLIDRIGVLLDLEFPCGPAMERLAKEAEGQIPLLQLPRDPNVISFAGAETALRRIWETQCISSAQIAAAVFDYIRRTFRRMLKNLAYKNNCYIIAVGGVMANLYLRQHFFQDAEKVGLDVVFALPEYSSDNATGNAYGALRRYYDAL